MSVNMSATDEELRASLAVANIPTMLMVLVHLTGDERYLREPFCVTPGRGLDVNDAGGLSDIVRERVRDDAFRVIRAWRDSGCLMPAPLPPERLAEMMTACVGEPVAAEYVPMMIEQMGWAPSVSNCPVPETSRSEARNPRVTVVGAGMSGILAGIRLGAAGIDYTIVEKNDKVGGTWFENTYPGCGVDTPGYLYSYSFESWTWSREYPFRSEVREYLEHCALKYGVHPNIQFKSEVIGARWDDDEMVWNISLRRGDGSLDEIVSKVLVSGVGQLNRPVVPPIDGLDTFHGPVAHTAQWDADLDVTGRSVAVVGTGASAMQFVPAIADIAREVKVFQRSPQWVSPNEHYSRVATTDSDILFDQVPFYRRWYRFRLFWMFNDKVHPTLQLDPSWPHPERSVNAANDRHRQFLTSYIRSELGDRQDLLDDVVPTYPPFGKRMLQDCGWFATLRRQNVALRTERVTRIEHDGLITDDGVTHPADVIVFATGFDSRRMLYPMRIEGRDGTTLRDVWGDENAQAYLGITVPGFPNLFCLYGPNTNPGHGGSVVFQAECQVEYLLSMLGRMDKLNLESVEVRGDVHDLYNAQVDAAHDRMIWTHQGMDVWYRNRNGRVVTNTPWRFVDYWRMTRSADPDDYVVRRPGGLIDDARECQRARRDPENVLEDNIGSQSLSIEI